MKKTLFFILGAAGAALALARPAAGEVLSADELIGAARVYDGRVVDFEGEAIRAVLPRGDHAWINLNDGTAAIGVWVPLAAAAEVRYAGAYKLRGDRALVRGVFHRACPEHQGALDIHAVSFRVAVAGGPLEEHLGRRKVVALAVLLGVLSCLLIFNLLNRKRARR
ncbi:MAG: DNA-binding protein [Deltaproteobacteria bacterium]